MEKMLFIGFLVSAVVSLFIYTGIQPKALLGMIWLATGAVPPNCR